MLIRKIFIKNVQKASKFSFNFLLQLAKNFKKTFITETRSIFETIDHNNRLMNALNF